MSDSTPFENYLSSKGLFIDTLTPQQLSEARAYETCYNWYVENQKVSADTADIASTVFIQKYALHNNEGICLENTPEDMWDRVANVLADEEIKTNTTSSVSRDSWYKLFRNILTNFKYTPQGSGLYSLGNPYVKSSASNCFVVPSPDDSLESIFDTAKSMARIYAARGGVGVDLSNLRPYGAVTNNAAKSSTGAASFMDFYSHVTATIGQCIEENQKVLTLRGNLSIKDVIPGDSVWTRKGWIKNLNTLNNGVKPVFKLTTKRGFEITATANHIFLSGDNSEKQLGDFVVGDSIITMPGTPVDNLPYVKLNTVVDYDQGHGALNGGNRLNEVSLPEELTEELAYLIGYSFGDGYVERDAFMEVKEISLDSSHDHPEVEAKLVNISKSKFAYSPSIKQKAKERVNSVRIFSKKLGFYLEQNGLLKQKHNALIMPDVIWQSRTSVQMAFISGYFDADGYASGNKKGYVIASVHMPILKDMQQMLMSAGIVSHISTELRNGKEKTENWKNLHSLSITGAYSQAIAIKMLSESVKIANKAFIAKRDNVLTPFTAKDCGIKYNKYSFVPDNTQKMSAKCYSKLQEEKLITDNITILDTVAAIEYIGEKPVFDLQLESEHLYVSAGMIVHNSGRRGALMLSLRVDHPDIFRFIEMKRDLDKQWFFDELASYGININDWKYSALADRLKSTSHANVSVKLTDKFIKAVEEDTDFELYFDFKENKYSRISNIVKARSIWDKLVEGATQSAEPGMFNWDKIISESPADCYSDMTEYIMPDGNKVSYSFRTLSTNPCGELPLSAGDSCCLGTHRLTAFVINPFKDNAKFDWTSFEETVRLSTRAQDNIKNIDIDLVPLQVNKDSAILGRRIGLGCTGLSDALAMLGLRYDSKEAVETAKKIYKLLRDTVYATSIQLAEEKGAFLVYDKAKEVNNPFLQRLPKELQGKPRRNIACLTNAPNGSMAILMSNEASGIEPCFKKTYERSMKIPGTNDFRRFTVYHQAIQKCIDAGGNPDVFVEANDVNGEMRIALQAGIQEFIDHSISVTTNLPVGTTKERVADLYLKAFKAGCKGFTIYIDECRTGVLNSIKDPVKIHKTIERPKTTNIDIHKVKYKEKNWAVLVGRVDNGPCEVFAGIEEDTPLPNKYHRAELTKKSRGHYSLTVFLSEDEDDLIKISNIGARFPSPEGMTLTRFISLSLKNGVSVADICEQLTKSSNSMFDYPAVLNRVLKNYVTEEEYLKKNGDKQCPECNGTLVFRKVDGCMIETCETCSYTNSKCG